MTVSLVIPMYNEEKRIKKTRERLLSYLREAYPGDFEILFSDDGSTDETIQELAVENYPECRLLRSSENRGKGNAVRKGMLAASGKFILFTDADLAYGTEYIKPTVELLQKADIVIGSRQKEGYKGYPLYRKILSRLYFFLLSRFGGIHVTDSQTGFKGFRKTAAQNIFKECNTDGFAFDYEVILRAEKKKYKIMEIPVTVKNPQKTKMNLLKQSFQMLSDVRKIRKNVNKNLQSKK